MGPKSIVIVILILVALSAIIGGMNGYFGQNDDQDWQVLQGLTGNMSVRTDSGIYQKKFATAWTYPKVQRVYFSSDVREGSTLDESCKVVFSDKGTATFSSMVLYRTPYMLAGLAIAEPDGQGHIAKGLKEGAVANFHRLCKGDINIANATVLARVKEYARIIASEFNASQSVDNQDEFISAIRQNLKADKTLISYGIDVEEVTLSDIVFDKKTLVQFEKQQEAILASKEAEANTIKFKMQKLRTEADYAQKIAEQKGIAEMEKVKQITDAERDKELAEISAAKKVSVAELAKKEAETKANMNLSVAAIEKEEALTVANKSLEVATIGAKEAEQQKLATILEAEGREQSIKLSGAITEKEKVLAQIAAEKDVQIAKSLKDMATPGMVIMGGSSDSNGGMQMPLLNVAIMKAAGILPADFSVTNPISTSK